MNFFATIVLGLAPIQATSFGPMPTQAALETRGIQTASRTTQRKRSADITQGPPIVFQELLQWVNRKVIPENRIVLAIKNRALATPLTDSEFDQLKAADAPGTVLQALRPPGVNPIPKIEV